MNNVPNEPSPLQAETLVELNAATRQYLRGLKEAGLESVPKGRGRFSFEMESLRPPTPQEPKTESARLERIIADIAKEPGVAYQLPSPNIAGEPGINSGEPNVRESQQLASARPQESPGLMTGNETTVDRSGYSPSLPLAQRRSELQLLADQVAGCKQCAELVQCRSRVVFGVGNPAPRLVFLGEAPGADEDRQGEPFVGAAGQLLTKIMAACRLSREDVYILNTIKCRPPGNRNPLPEELDNCWSFTQRQLDLLRPEFICCLGLIATKQLLKTTLPLGQLRQKFHQYRDSRVVVTYHPAYLLRTESAKKFVWEDMKMLMQAMGVDISR